MDFVTGLPSTPKGRDTIWVIFNRLTKSAHFAPINISFPVPKLAEIYIRVIVKLHGVPSSIISDRDQSFTFKFWKTLHDALGSKDYRKGETNQREDEIFPEQAKSYHDKRRKNLEFQARDHVGAVAYRVALPPNLSNLHDVFHVSQLRKYILDPSHVILMDDVQVRDNLIAETVPVRIEDCQVKKMRGKEISLVKLVWGGVVGDNATWELESKMRESYPEMFASNL
ncbi:uncharacterized protein LOC131649681 [Vicia villosa]|uniref:uncharacterized protein LOC131649681 n=1 Tax=Vicia villosa TaxID=3911 RepID=UPI00273B1D97|nr:uncharacterized protein LOC131649681 [Vicia villosa]